MNSVFVVDISSPHVKHFKNVLADDRGVWNPTGIRQQFYHAVREKNPIKKALTAEYKGNEPHLSLREEMRRKRQK